MSPQMRRLAPLLLIVLALLILLPLFRGSGGKGLSSKQRAAWTKHALSVVDAAEVAYRAEHNRYTDHLADLIPAAKGLVRDLGVVTVRLDAGSNGGSYVAQVTSDVLGLVRARSGARITGNSCVVLKRGSGVKCAAA